MKKLLGKIKRKLHSLRQDRKDQFIFIHINKTGGSSVEKALNINFEHKTALEKIEEVGRDSWNRKLTFTIVRNPWDKVVSHYHYRVDTNQTGLGDKHIDFKDWVKRTYRDRDDLYYDNPKMFMPQLDWIADESGRILVDDVLHFENLDRDFNTLLRKLGRSTTLPHVKSSSRGGYQEYYDSETTEIVRKWFERDIEMFGYHFQEPRI